MNKVKVVLLVKVVKFVELVMLVELVKIVTLAMIVKVCRDSTDPEQYCLKHQIVNSKA